MYVYCKVTVNICKTKCVLIWPYFRTTTTNQVKYHNSKISFNLKIK